MYRAAGEFPSIPGLVKRIPDYVGINSRLSGISFFDNLLIILEFWRFERLWQRKIPGFFPVPREFGRLLTAVSTAEGRVGVARRGQRAG
jgi:hypothetical protein